MNDVAKLATAVMRRIALPDGWAWGVLVYPAHECHQITLVWSRGTYRVVMATIGTENTVLGSILVFTAPDSLMTRMSWSADSVRRAEDLLVERITEFAPRLADCLPESTQPDDEEDEG